MKKKRKRKNKENKEQRADGFSGFYLIMQGIKLLFYFQFLSFLPFADLNENCSQADSSSPFPSHMPVLISYPLPLLSSCSMSICPPFIFFNQMTQLLPYPFSFNPVLIDSIGSLLLSYPIIPFQTRFHSHTL